jgi:hypothetical protein
MLKSGARTTAVVWHSTAVGVGTKKFAEAAHQAVRRDSMLDASVGAAEMTSRAARPRCTFPGCAYSGPVAHRFLYPNGILEREGLMERKGSPESYDLSALLRVLSDVRRAAFAASSYVLANSIDLASEGSSGSSGGIG